MVQFIHLRSINKNIIFFAIYSLVRLPCQPGLCAKMVFLVHFLGTKSEKLRRVLENFFMIIKHKMNIKRFTE